MTIKMIILRMRYALIAGLLSGASLFTGMSGCNPNATRQLAAPERAGGDESAGHDFADWFVVLNP